MVIVCLQDFLGMYLHWNVPSFLSRTSIGTGFRSTSRQLTLSEALPAFLASTVNSVHLFWTTPDFSRPGPKAVTYIPNINNSCIWNHHFSLSIKLEQDMINIVVILRFGGINYWDFEKMTVLRICNFIDNGPILLCFFLFFLLQSTSDLIDGQNKGIHKNNVHWKMMKTQNISTNTCSCCLNLTFDALNALVSGWIWTM